MIYKGFKINIPKVNVATGLYSHWDSIVKFDKKIMEWIKSSNKTKPKNILLGSIGEVIYTLSEAMEKGGKEFLISEKLYKKLKSIFPGGERKIGGNGNNMGKTLFLLGNRPLVSYPLRPEKLMEASPNFKAACKSELKTPKECIRKNDPEYEHIVFEFKNTRHIFSWDPMSSKGIFDYDFLKFASNKEFTDILILGYAHLLLPKYKKRTDEIIEFLNKPNRPRVHLEFGLGCNESMKYAMDKFVEHDCCESWGLNEKECMKYLGAKSESKDDLVEAALDSMKEYNLKRICVHTPKFVFSISKYNIDREIDALRTAVLVSAAMTFDRLDFKSAKKLPIKAEPIKKKVEKYSFCLFPSLLNPSPKNLTGIGDGFTAVQATKTLVFS